MKKLNLILTAIILSVTLSVSCQKENTPDAYKYAYQNDYIRDTMLLQMSKEQSGPNIFLS